MKEWHPLYTALGNRTQDRLDRGDNRDAKWIAIDEVLELITERDKIANERWAVVKDAHAALTTEVARLRDALKAATQRGPAPASGNSAACYCGGLAMTDGKCATCERPK